MIEEQ